MLEAPDISALHLPRLVLDVDSMLEAPDRLVSSTPTLTGFGCRQDVGGT